MISYVSNIQLNASQYYDIVVTYNGTTAHIYVNSVDSANPANLGVPIAGSSVNTSLYYSPSIFNNTKGNLLLFRMYNRTLTQAEVTQNYEDNKWRYLSTISDNNIINIQKKAYGDGGLPSYMGNYAVQKQSDGLYVFSDSLSGICTVTAPYYQDNGGSEKTATLLSYNINGVKWKNYYAPGSTIALNYTGTNRSINQIGTLSNNAFDLTNTVNYTGPVLTVIDGVNVTGNGNYQMYGDGIATISGNVVKSLTDDATVQTNKLFNSTGGIIYTNYQRRDAGISRTNNLEVVLSSPQLTMMPAPSGYKGVMAFVNHPDSTTPDSLAAIMYGTNDTQNSTYGTKGFLAHNLVGTWGVFAESYAENTGFDNARYKSIIDDMYVHGFEIVPHNVEGDVGNDIPNRTVTAYYLPWYITNYSSRNWIDHGLGGGARNTGLKSLGYDSTSQYYIMDLLHDDGIKYAWAFQDVTSEFSLNMVRTSYVGLPVDIVWTNTNLNLSDGAPVYQWISEEDGDTEAMNYFTSSNIDALINNYGIVFWHAYWASLDPVLKNYYFTQASSYTINDSFDSFLTYVANKKTNGDLWNPTVSQYIDYYIQCKNVSIKCTGVNTYTVVNNNPTVINGYALRVTGSYTPKLDGVTLPTKTNGADTIFWMDLQPGVHVIALGA